MNSNACNVCQQAFNSPNNPLEECFICNYRVHQSCYGFTRARNIEKFYCHVCRIKPNMNVVTCELCPMKEGIFRPIEDSKKYAHVLCALCIPEVKFLDNATMEVISIKNVPSKVRRKCVLCARESNSKGGFVKCAKENCVSYVHVTCAAAKHLLEMPLTQELSLKKNLAILFKSAPELNIGKHYPVKLKHCLAFCDLSHYMVRCAEVSPATKLLRLPYSLIANQPTRVNIPSSSTFSKRPEETNKDETQTYMEESQTRQEPNHDNIGPAINKENKDPTEIVNCIKPSTVSKSPPAKNSSTVMGKRKRGRPRKDTSTNLPSALKERQLDKSQSSAKGSQSTKQQVTVKSGVNSHRSTTKSDHSEETPSATKKPREELGSNPHESGISRESETTEISKRPSLVNSIVVVEKELAKECPDSTNGCKPNKEAKNNNQSASKKPREEFTTRPQKSRNSCENKTAKISERSSLVNSTEVEECPVGRSGCNPNEEAKKNKSCNPGRFSKTRSSKEPLPSKCDGKAYRGKEIGRHSSLTKNRPDCEVCGSKVERRLQFSEISSFDELFEWDYQQSLKKIIKNAPDSMVMQQTEPQMTPETTPSLVSTLYFIPIALGLNDKQEYSALTLLHDMFELKRQNKKLEAEVKRLKEKEAFYKCFNEKISKHVARVEIYKASMEDSPPIIMSSVKNNRQEQPISTGFTQSTPKRTATAVQLKLPETEITTNGRLSIPVNFESSSLIEDREPVMEAPKRRKFLSSCIVKHLSTSRFRGNYE
ncbi:unnamed protein product [Rodentolepis nana]|uniref:PHD-type domain-containing protein n=1 Tax=Rodentolepis nana TaxID=102285 RepID=A0A0R3TSW7_RODNA|nr:unnamed protein product [Rodentolepis nana]